MYKDPSPAWREESGFQPRDYACTFLGAVIGPRIAAFLQIGDGAIVIADTEDGNDGHTWVVWPQHGEFANSTFFITMENASQIMEFDRREASDERSFIRELVMFSDGLERFDPRHAGPHRPFPQPAPDPELARRNGASLHWSVIRSFGSLPELAQRQPAHRRR